MAKPTICFATMCKDEEHCIRETLESVYQYIDYWVVHDTGSTDNTCRIVEDFFKEKNIPGELFVDKWQGFDVNKTMLFERCFGKADYILHLDADDILSGNFNFLNEDRGYLQYLFKTKRGSAEYKCSVLFDNYVHWKFIGVAHTIIRCLDNPKCLKDRLDLSHRDFFYYSRDTGKRSEDKEKYLKDALRLKDQFFRTLIDDPEGINNRSVFYTAQSYYDQHMFLEAAQFYSLYTKLKDTWSEEVFESNLRLITCRIKLNHPLEEIIKQAEKTMKIFSDRAEPFYVLGKHLNNISRCDLGYKYLFEAKQKNLEKVMKNYTLFVNKKTYGKYVNDELSVACYWTNRYDEGLQLIRDVENDPELAYNKEHFFRNTQHFLKKLNEKEKGAELPKS